MPQIKITAKEFDSLKEALRLAKLNAKKTRDYYRSQEAEKMLQGMGIESFNDFQLASSWEEKMKEYSSLEQTLRSMQIGDTLKFG